MRSQACIREAARVPNWVICTPRCRSRQCCRFSACVRHACDAPPGSASWGGFPEGVQCATQRSCRPLLNRPAAHAFSLTTATPAIPPTAARDSTTSSHLPRTHRGSGDRVRPSVQRLLDSMTGVAASSATRAWTSCQPTTSATPCTLPASPAGTATSAPAGRSRSAASDVPTGRPGAPAPRPSTSSASDSRFGRPLATSAGRDHVVVDLRIPCGPEGIQVWHHNRPWVPSPRFKINPTPHSPESGITHPEGKRSPQSPAAVASGSDPPCFVVAGRWSSCAATGPPDAWTSRLWEGRAHARRGLRGPVRITPGRTTTIQRLVGWRATRVQRSYAAADPGRLRAAGMCRRCRPVPGRRR